MRRHSSRFCTLAAFFIVTTTSTLQAAQILGIERLGTAERPAGTVLVFDSSDPGNAQVLGDIGLGSVGAVDYHRGVLWAADCSGNTLRFHMLDLVNMQARLISTADAQDGTYVYGGSFDSQGRFWVSNNTLHLVLCYDPTTGQQLAAVPFAQASRTIPAITFVGETLYALTAASPNGPFSLGTFDLDTGAFTALMSAPAGGSQGLDYDPASGKLFFTFAVDTSLYEADLEAGTYHTLGQIIPGSTFDAIAVIEELPPIIADIEPDPALAIAGASYVRRLTTSQGTIPLDWVLFTDVPGAVIDADGNLSGWTPTGADINMTFTFEVRVSNTQGTDTKIWQATVRSTMDFNRDGDVDQHDFGHLQVCMTGRLAAVSDPNCLDADLNQDSHVDEFDMTAFIQCLSGTGVTPGTDCGN